MMNVHQRILPLFALLLTGALACSSSSDGGGDGDGSGGDTPLDESGEPTDAELNGIVKAHNDVRATVGTSPLTWSDEAAAVAKSYAEKCNWGHNDDREGFGENLYASTGDAGPAAVVGSWAEEEQHYDPATGECARGEVCGHYTQIVWSSTTKVGCAKQLCTKNSPMGGGNWTYWVCNYDPPGNYSGQKAY